MNQTPLGQIAALVVILFTYIPDGLNLFFNLKLNKKFLEMFLKLFSINEVGVQNRSMESDPFLFSFKNRISSLVGMKRSFSTPKQKSLEVSPNTLNIDKSNSSNIYPLIARDNIASSSHQSLRQRHSLHVTTSAHSGFSSKCFKKRFQNSIHNHLHQPFSLISKKSISVAYTNTHEPFRTEERDSLRRHSLHHFTSSLSSIGNKCMRQRHVSLRASYSKLNASH